MTKRKKYEMPNTEIEALIAGLLQRGAEEVYGLMYDRAMGAMTKSSQLDEEFLDRSETLITMARGEPNSIEEPDEPSMRDIYYTLAFLLRRLAHHMNHIYIKQGKKKTSDRFLRVVSENKTYNLLV